RRAEERQRDAGEAPPRAGAVDARCLVDRRVDGLEARQEEERGERRRLPHVGEDDRHPRGGRAGEPGGFEKETPYQRGDEGGQRPGKERDRARGTSGPPAEGAVEDER